MAAQPNPAIGIAETSLSTVPQKTSDDKERKDRANNRRNLAAILADPETDAQDKFLAWILTSEFDRKPKTQAKLAGLLGVNVATLSKWKSSPEFARRFRESARRYGTEQLGGVIDQVFRQALEGNTRAQELVLKYFLGDVQEAPAPLVNINDNRMNVTIGGKPAEQLRVGLVQFAPVANPVIDVKPPQRNESGE